MSDDIDQILNDIAKVEVVEEKVEETKEIEVREKNEIINASDTAELEQELVRQTVDDRAKADQIFDLFYADLGFHTDRSQASKEAITRALELKIQASKNIIDLLKLKKETSSKMGVFVNTVSPEKAGIDIRNIQNELE